jgi:O-antigen ligase
MIPIYNPMTKNTKNNKAFQNRFLYIYDAITLSLIGYNSINLSNSLSVLLVLMIVMGLFFKNDIYCLYTMVALFPFEYALNVSEKSLLVIINLFFIFRVIQLNKQKGIHIIPILSAMIIIILEVLNSGLNGIGLGTLVHWLSIFLYFIIVIVYIDFKKWNQVEMSKYFLTSYLVVVVATFYASGGNFEIFVGNSEDIIISENRFGYDLSNLGGAMGISYYSAINIALMLINLNDGRSTKLYKIISMFAIMVSILIGLISVSRMFFIGLLLIILFYILNTLYGKAWLKKLFTSLTLFISMLTVFFIMNDVFESLLNRLFTRMEEISADSRLEIQIDSLTFLSKNILQGFIGLGANYYPKYGDIYGYLFSAHTHNLYLDGLMSWGITGSIALIMILIYFTKKCKYINDFEVSLLTTIPLLLIAVWFLTAGTFTSFRDYTFIIIGVGTHYLGKRKEFL